MKISELTVDVKANLTVDKRTAEACLKLVEIYVNHNDVNVMADRCDDGSVQFWYKER